ncbi:MAG: DUF4421 family protein [Bacteroidia bacterium]|nr:DUF4421 family protein [Bacteroidia bacterium]
MRLKQTIFVLLMLAGFFSQAQKKIKEKEDKKPKEKKEKPLPENIESFPKNFLVRPRFVYPIVSVNVSSRLLGKGDKFTYLPAMPGVVGLALKIKKVYISVAVQLPANESLKQKYGSSKFRNININIHGRITQWGLFYRDYKGFYLSNYQKYYPDYKVDSLGYPKSPGLRIIESGLNFGINFNRNFSMNAAFSQGERQKRGAGSFLMGFSERYQRIDADTSFVPPGQGDKYPNLNKLQYGNFYSTIISMGAGYQFVIRKKIHFTPIAMIGTGFQVQSYAQTRRNKLRLNYLTYANLKGQVGYNGDHFFANVIYGIEFNSIPITESRIRLIHKWFEVGAGLRF